MAKFVVCPFRGIISRNVTPISSFHVNRKLRNFRVVVRSSSFINLCYIYKCTLQQNFPDLRKFNIFSNRCSIQNYPPTFFTSLIFCLYFYMTMKLIWNRFTVLPSKPLLTAINSLPNSKVLHLSKFKAVSGQSPLPRTIAPPPPPSPQFSPTQRRFGSGLG